MTSVSTSMTTERQKASSNLGTISAMKDKELAFSEVLVPEENKIALGKDDGSCGFWNVHGFFWKKYICLIYN